MKNGKKMKKNTLGKIVTRKGEPANVKTPVFPRILLVFANLRLIHYVVLLDGKGDFWNESSCHADNPLGGRPHNPLFAAARLPIQEPHQDCASPFYFISHLDLYGHGFANG